MIFEIMQMKTNFNMVWIAEQNKKSLATAISPFEKGQLNIAIDYNEEKKQRLYYNPNHAEKGVSLVERMAFKLFSEDKQIGTIVGKNQKVKGFLQSYPYRVMDLMGDKYFLYEVGFGNNGLYLCIYKENELIAIADKDLKVVNFQDKYTVYTLDDSYMTKVMPLILHYDMTAHGDMMEISLRNVSHKKVNTIQKELIAKYDPTFIEKVKAVSKMNHEGE